MQKGHEPKKHFVSKINVVISTESWIIDREYYIANGKWLIDREKTG
jgi:hypothetical protein